MTQKPPRDFDDNPEWTEADFAQARPASEVLPPDVVAALRHERGVARAITGQGRLCTLADLAE